MQPHQAGDAAQGENTVLKNGLPPEPLGLLGVFRRFPWPESRIEYLSFMV